MNSTNLVWREFTQEDWYGFAGALQEHDDKPPMICEDVEQEERSRIAVVDDTGLCIMELVSESGECSDLVIPTSYDCALAMARTITAQTIWHFQLNSN